jgi:hypothetical protein
MHRSAVEVRSGGQAVVDDHAHRGHTERRTDRTRGLRQCRRRPHCAHRDLVLDRDHEDLHHHPEPDTGDDHVRGRLGIRRRRVHPREQEEPGREHDRPDERVRSVVTAAGDPLAGDRAGGDSAEHERSQDDAEEVAEVPMTPWTKSGTNAIVPTIAIGRQADRSHARGDDRVAQELERQDRLLRPPLDEHERRRRDERDRERPEHLLEPHGCVSPPQTSPSRNELVPIASRRRPEQVERVLATLRPLRDRDRDHGQARTDGQVDVEHPAPGRVSTIRPPRAGR